MPRLRPLLQWWRQT